MTDSQGEYKLVDLRLGTYDMTFSLTGFTTVKRAGIELPAGVTVNVNVELKVGTLNETITVSGQTPLVDTQNVTQHTAMTRTILDQLPTGRQFGNYGVLVPGVVTNIQDVGGSSNTVSTTNIMGVHGSNANEMPMMIDGMRYGNVFGTSGGASGPYIVNNGIVQEMAIDTSGAGADAEVGGFRTNVVLKAGGNNFSSSWYAGGYSGNFVTNNIDQALKNRGALTPSAIARFYDFNVGAGGPILKDKGWFYGSYRTYGLQQIPTGAYRAKDPTAIAFKPPTIVNGAITAANSADLSSPPVNPLSNMNFNARVIWQTSVNSKLSVYGDQMPRCVCANGLSATATYEATTHYHNNVNGIQQVTWNWTATNRLLIELGETFKPDSWQFDAQDGIPTDRFAVFDLGTGISSHGAANRVAQDSFQENGKAVVTYVTGSSNLKTGVQWFQGHRTAYTYTGGNATLQLLNGVPQFVVEQTTPLVSQETLNMNFAAFAQEQYTLKKLTLNLGVRFDYLHESVPAQTTPAVPFAQSLSYPAIDNIPDWKDISPRLGVAYDVFGNGKTALRWYLGRFVEAQAAGFPQGVNPTRAPGTTSGRRIWTDTNGNLLPDCDLANYAANGECGAVQNPLFGTTATSAYRYDPAAVTGWGTRGYNWELGTGVSHQITNGLSIDASYNRRWFGNFRAWYAANVTPSNYTPYCVTTPVDPRLPSGGGQQICGFYNINPGFVGQDQTNIVIGNASKFGNSFQHYDGVDVDVKLRLPRGVLLQGGASAGRTISNWCGVVNGNPQVTQWSPYVGVSSNPSAAWTQFSTQAPFCQSAPPFQTQWKLAGVYPLPYGISTSATFQSIIYPQEFYGAFGGILAARQFPSKEIAPTLGRPLSNGASATLQMIPAGTVFGDRTYQVDWRIARTFTIRKSRVQPQLDIFNLFNGNQVLTLNNTYGALWQQPTAILTGRVVKLGAQLDF